MFRKRYFVRLSLAILLVFVALAVAWFIDDYESAMKRTESRGIAKDVDGRLRLGMTREEVEQAIGKDWKTRYRCGREDIYLIGDSNPHRAAFLFLAFRGNIGETQVLADVGGLDEDMLPSFETCPASFQ